MADGGWKNADENMRSSHGVAGFRCCRRNCDAKHRGTRPFRIVTPKHSDPLAYLDAPNF